MNALVKKEIRLLLPSWAAAALLAMVQGVTRPYDFYVASLLFFGLTIMALTTIGREASLNTFSSLLAQPAERMRIWQTKLSVLAAGFLTVFAVWLAALGIAFWRSNVAAAHAEHSYNLVITACLIATATFTGGLWTTLLLRQLAGAFWLTLLMPVTLSAFSGIFLAGSESDNLVIAVLSVVIGVYSVAGFLFARWLFFRAQDVGWSGGVIAMPEWKFLSARTQTAGEARTRKPVLALFKKEVQLQQGVLTGAAALLVLHAGIIALRVFHKFPNQSAGEILTSIFWMLWLVVPALLGSIAVAEERKHGVTESQLCLPVSRRLQFVIKAVLTLVLGTLLGGVLPMWLESLGIRLGVENSMFAVPNGVGWWFQVGVVAMAAALALVSFFASSLAKNFLQAVGIALVTFIALMMCLPTFANQRTNLLYSIAPHSILPLVLAVPAIPVALLWLAFLNFKNFRGGWPLWRRNLLGAGCAAAFIVVGSAAIYHRAWEVFEPAEPAHGPAKLSLANPPLLRSEPMGNLLVRLPDGRVWFDFLRNRFPSDGRLHWRNVWGFFNPLPFSAGPQAFIAGSNWVWASAYRVDAMAETGPHAVSHVASYYADTVGVKADGTLWVSAKFNPLNWTPDNLIRFGDQTNWQQLVRGWALTSVWLLKQDGTLWRWGTNRLDFRGWPQKWPGLRTFQPYQIGNNADWTGLYSLGGLLLARKADGSVWRVGNDYKTGKDQIIPATNYDGIVTENCGTWGAYVRHDGTLWLFGNLRGSDSGFENLQSGRDTNWVSVARLGDWMVAIKSDGTLWQWHCHDLNNPAKEFTAPPTRLGIHRDWIAVAGANCGIVTLAADGSLWFWLDPEVGRYAEILMRPPKQPQFLGNVFGAAN